MSAAAKGLSAAIAFNTFEPLHDDRFTDLVTTTRRPGDLILPLSAASITRTHRLVSMAPAFPDEAKLTGRIKSLPFRESLLRSDPTAGFSGRRKETADDDETT
jgi:hypothetical protein